MDNIAVVTDSTSDLSQAEAKKHGISIIPLSVIHRSKVYLDGIDIQPESFYPMLQESNELPKTSQPTPSQFEELYNKLLESGKEILSIHLSKGLSSTFDTARAVAKRISETKIHVIDSGLISYGIAFQAIEAVKLAKKGLSPSEIITKIAELRDRTEVVFTLDTLHYLHKGGRIGKVSSLVGNLLGIKPVIRVENGIYVPIGKARSIKQALKSISEHLSAKYGKEKVNIAVGHGQGLKYASMLKEMVGKALNISEEPSDFEVGPVIGVHTGPGTVGIGVRPVEY